MPTRAPTHAAEPAPETLARLVACVVRPGAAVIRLRPDNSGQPTPSDVSMAVAAGWSWTAELADGVIALDLDDPATAARSASRLQRALTGVGLEPVVLASGGVGRRHVWVRCATPADVTAVRWSVGTERERGGCIDWRRSCRPPGVPHRSGATPRLFSHDSWDAAADALTPTVLLPPTTRPASGTVDLDRVVVDALAACELQDDDDIPVGRRYAGIVRTGAHNHRSDSDAVYAVACSWVWHAGEGDAARDQFVTTLLASPLMQKRLQPVRSGEPTRQRQNQRRRQVQWLVRQWMSASEFVGSSSAVGPRPEQLPSGIQEDLDTLDRWAAKRFRTGGQSGRTDALVLRDLIRRAGTEGRLHLLETSTRMVVEDLAGAVRTHRSVYVAWRRLAEAGVMRIERRGRGTTGSLLSLLPQTAMSLEQREFAPSVSTPPEGGPTEHPPTLATPQRSGQRRPPGEGDLLTALSPAAIEAYHLLRAHADGLSTAELAAAVGMRPRSLRRVGGGHLGPVATLVALGLVNRRDTGQWCACVDPDIDEALTALDVRRPPVTRSMGARRLVTWRGALDRVVARHKVEREEYSSWLIQTAEQRAQRREDAVWRWLAHLPADQVRCRRAQAHARQVLDHRSKSPLDRPVATTGAAAASAAGLPGSRTPSSSPDQIAVTRRSAKRTGPAVAVRAASATVLDADDRMAPHT